MADFKFDVDKSAEANIESFFLLLKVLDEEMTELLKGNIDKMIPLPTDPRQRSKERFSFNEAIMKGLENLNKPKGNKS